MRVILVDDEPIALKVLKSVLSTYKEIDIVGSYTDPIVALESINTIEPDVIFLDIEMGSVNGLEIADDFIRKKNFIEIVFVTAYSKYAIEAFELNAIDYVLKPPQRNRLNKTIKRLIKRFKNCERETQEKNNILKVDCFGHFEVRDNMDRPLTWRTQKSKELFALLLVEKNISKDLIIETILSDRNLEKANTFLHTIIYQLRKSLNNLGFSDSITYLNGEYSLNLPIDSDFYKMEELVNLNSHHQEDILEILKIYKGDFLEYEGYQWALGIQKDYRDLVVDILLDFANIQISDNINSPILKDTLKLLYNLDAFNENIAKATIEYYGKQGYIDDLKDFFKEYKDNLWREMNIKPMENTQRLYGKYCNLK